MIPKRTSFLSKISIPWYVFAILSFIYLSFVPNANEENYLQLAKQFYNPEWIKNSITFNEFPGTRLLYQYIVGFLLEFIAIENLVFLMRLVLISAFSVIIANIYKVVDFNRIQVLFHLLILFIAHQSLFAGSWMLISVEPKGFAYAFVLLAFYYILQNRIWLSLSFLLVGSYFHILVGFYSFVYIVLSLLIFRRSNNFTIKVFLTFITLYILFILPNIVYLLGAISNYDTSLKPSPSWIYTYFRSPHHTALFKSANFFYQKHLFGICLSIIALYFSIKTLKLNSQSKALFINQFVTISFIGTLALVVLALVDKTGVYLKYYPYRINTLSTFFLMILITKWLWDVFDIKKSMLTIEIIVIFSVLFLFKLSIPNILRNYHYFHQSDPMLEVGNYIKQNASKNAIVFSFIDDLTMIRKLQRDRYVVRKFIPAELSKIHNWYHRIKKRKQAISNIANLKNIIEETSIEFILTDQKGVTLDYVDLVFENSKYKLYYVNYERESK